MEFPAPWPLHTIMPSPATTLNNDLCASRFQLFVYTTTTTTLAEPSFFVFLCCCCWVFLWVLLCMGYTWTRNERKDCLCYTTVQATTTGNPFWFACWYHGMALVVTGTGSGRWEKRAGGRRHFMGKSAQRINFHLLIILYYYFGIKLLYQRRNTIP